MLSEKFSRAHAFVAKWEGGLSDDAFDKGGITKYGVSYVFLHGMQKSKLAQIGITPPVTTETIKNLTKEQAQSAFFFNFWLPGKCEELPEPLGMIIYDFGVNCGLKTAIKKLQQACKDLGENIVVDGIIGPQTINALKKCCTKQGIRHMMEIRREYYNRIVASNKTQNKFLKGWLNRVNDLEKTVLKRYEEVKVEDEKWIKSM